VLELEQVEPEVDFCMHVVAVGDWYRRVERIVLLEEVLGNSQEELPPEREPRQEQKRRRRHVQDKSLEGVEIGNLDRMSLGR